MFPDVYTRLPDVVPLPIPSEQLKELVEKSKDWALMHGAAMRSKTNFSPDALCFAPFNLIPSPFPRKEFEKAVQIQLTLNKLIHCVANSRKFLTSCLRDTIKADGFTRKLFEIYDTVMEEGMVQCNNLGLLRSDYMLHSSSNNIKQVELNTVASSFGGITGKAVYHFNRFVLQELGYDDKLKNLPENNALQGLCEGMLDAWTLYGREKAVILFVVEDVTYNICDQRFHEFEIRKLNPKVRVIRRTLTEIAHSASLGPKKELIIDNLEISVIYFRAGYVPDHYPSEKEWEARLLMERSLAIKCPSIQFHLAGTKKVQQVLAKEGVLEQFLKNPKEIELIKGIFTGLYGLDFDDLGEQAIQMAISDPERFVLKPQREGGGNNIYGLEVRNVIIKMKECEERTAWILMEKILPPLSRGYIVKPGGPDVPELIDLISELGIFGVILSNSKEIIVNKQVGHMLRTKATTANEGGVASGLGALDSPYLID